MCDLVCKMTQGMDTLTTKVETTCATLIIQHFKVLREFHKQPMSLSQLSLGNMTLVHNANTSN